MVELIREEKRNLEGNGWINHFTWVKAQDNNTNDLKHQLAKEAARDDELDIIYKYPKSALISELKELKLQRWRSEWDSK